MNETGMAYFDGKSWFHLWCNVNEGIGNANQHEEFYSPSQWRFIDSSVLKADCTELILASRHSVTVGGTPLIIDRFGFIKAGSNYLVLLIKISNKGTASANYYYTYGDEPWLGDFGSSAGNVGWINGRILNFEETIDVRKNSSAGFFDYGNSDIGEGHNFSGVANFIDWRWGKKPDLVYISNQPKKADTGNSKIPLFSNSRFIGLQWGPQNLRPGEAMTYTLTIGMADKAPISGFPLTPDIKFSFSGIEMLLR
jgi:hypothetical protein